MTRRDTRHPATPESPPLRYVIAARIREGQADKGWNTPELAAQTGISLRLVQKHRAGDNGPGDIALRKYADALGRPLNWFFTGEPYRGEEDEAA